MNLLSVFLIGVGLSMDAFAAAICKGLSIRKNFLEKSFVIALFFGVFQAVMPYIGYLLGSIFAEKLQAVDHWIAFVLLSIIGVNMIRESRDKTCSGSVLCLLEDKNIPCSICNWTYNFCHFLFGSANRKGLWHCLKGQGTSDWRFNFNFSRTKNFS